MWTESHLVAFEQSFTTSFYKCCSGHVTSSHWICAAFSHDSWDLSPLQNNYCISFGSLGKLTTPNISLPGIEELITEKHFIITVIHLCFYSFSKYELHQVS